MRIHSVYVGERSWAKQCCHSWERCSGARDAMGARPMGFHHEIWTQKLGQLGDVWMFPEIVVPPNHPFLYGFSL